MSEGGEEKASGVLRNYLEDSGLIEYENGVPKANFEYVEPANREPEGFFDYVLQTFVDFGSEDMGGTNTLEFSTDREEFEMYTKVQKLNSSLLTDSIMDRYGFDIEDPYNREGFNAGRTELGNSLKIFFNKLDYSGVIETHRGNEYTEGITEEQVNEAITKFYDI